VLRPAAVPEVVRRALASVGRARAVAFDGGRDRLLPDESTAGALVHLPAALGRAVPRRVAGFLAGRHCAAAALADAGYPGIVTLPIGAAGAPVWPAGFVGSITHTPHFALAAAARASLAAGLGVDSEPLLNEETAAEIASSVLPETGEIRRVGDSTAHLEWEGFVTAVFSAKESVYKCLRPITGEFFEFADVHVTEVDVAAGRLALRPIRALGGGVDAGTALTAWFGFEGGHAHSCVVLPASWVPDFGLVMR
jgi:enterobactin synthetase component D